MGNAPWTHAVVQILGCYKGRKMLKNSETKGKIFGALWAGEGGRCRGKNRVSILFPCGKPRRINSSFLADLSVQESDVNAKYGACVTGWASPMRTSMAMCV